MHPELQETDINIISEETKLEGKITLSKVSRVYGTLEGEINATPGSTLILAETGVIEGQVDGDVLIIDGFVRGNITAQTRVTVSRTGRVLGNISTPSLQLEFGSHFEGRSSMNSEKTARLTGPSDPSRKPS